MKLYTRHRRIQTGFGIIEIMIALALGVIIMLGVTQIATNNSSTRYELDNTGRQMENASFALREIENDLTNAAFWGEKGAESPGTFPPVCPVDSAGLEDSMGFPVQGWQQGEDLGSNVFDCENLGEITPAVGTDYLAIRRASSCAAGDPGCAAADSNFHLQVHSCAKISPRAGEFDISSDVTSLKHLQRSCKEEELAPIYRFLNRIYYVKNHQLIRAELVRTEVAGAYYTETLLVDGVEGMFLEYGMDRLNGDGDPIPDGQVDPDDGITLDPTDDPANPGTAKPEDWADVVMVRVSLVVHNMKPSAGFTDDKVYQLDTIDELDYCADDPGDDDNDAYDGDRCDLDIPAEFENHRRQVYSRTVGLRNVAGRREVAP